MGMSFNIDLDKNSLGLLNPLVPVQRFYCFITFPSRSVRSYYVANLISLDQKVSYNFKVDTLRSNVLLAGADKQYALATVEALDLFLTKCPVKSFHKDNIQIALSKMIRTWLSLDSTAKIKALKLGSKSLENLNSLKKQLATFKNIKITPYITAQADEIYNSQHLELMKRFLHLTEKVNDGGNHLPTKTLKLKGAIENKAITLDSFNGNLHTLKANVDSLHMSMISHYDDMREIEAEFYGLDSDWDFDLRHDDEF